MSWSNGTSFLSFEVRCQVSGRQEFILWYTAEEWWPAIRPELSKLFFSCRWKLKVQAENFVGINGGTKDPLQRSQWWSGLVIERSPCWHWSFLGTSPLSLTHFHSVSSRLPCVSLTLSPSLLRKVFTVSHFWVKLKGFLRNGSLGLDFPSLWFNMFFFFFWSLWKWLSNSTYIKEAPKWSNLQTEMLMLGSKWYSQDANNYTFNRVSF